MIWRQRRPTNVVVLWSMRFIVEAKRMRRKSFSVPSTSLLLFLLCGWCEFAAGRLCGRGRVALFVAPPAAEEPLVSLDPPDRRPKRKGVISSLLSASISDCKEAEEQKGSLVYFINSFMLKISMDPVWLLICTTILYNRAKPTPFILDDEERKWRTTRRFSYLK